MTIQINGSGLELTEAIRDYVDDKIGGLEKYYSALISAKVDLIMTTKRHLNDDGLFEVKAHLHAAGHDFHASATTHDLYASIDEVHNDLKIETQRYKEKTINASRQPRPDKQ